MRKSATQETVQGGLREGDTSTRPPDTDGTLLLSLSILLHPSLPDTIRGLETCIFLISDTFPQGFKLQDEGKLGDKSLWD